MPDCDVVLRWHSVCVTASSTVWVSSSSSLSAYYYVCHFYLIRTDSSVCAYATIPSYCLYSHRVVELKKLQHAVAFFCLFFLSFERLLWWITAVMTVLVCLSRKNKDQLWFFSTRCRDSFFGRISKKYSQNMMCNSEVIVCRNSYTDGWRYEVTRLHFPRINPEVYNVLKCSPFYFPIISQGSRMPTFS